MPDWQFYNKRVIATEKMDGENTTLYSDYCHPRSTNGYDANPCNSWIKTYHAAFKRYIPEHMRVCGENLHIKHTIPYDNLESYFLGFSVWSGDDCLSWDSTKVFLKLIGIAQVKELYDGIWDYESIIKLGDKVIANGGEGIVIRLADSFLYDDFSKSVVKYRKGFVIEKNDHWKYNKADYEHNGLKMVNDLSKEDIKRMRVNGIAGAKAGKRWAKRIGSE